MMNPHKQQMILIGVGGGIFSLSWINVSIWKSNLFINYCFVSRSFKTIPDTRNTVYKKENIFNSQPFCFTVIPYMMSANALLDMSQSQLGGG